MLIWLDIFIFVFGSCKVLNVSCLFLFLNLYSYQMAEEYADDDEAKDVFKQLRIAVIQRLRMNDSVSRVRSWVFFPLIIFIFYIFLNPFCSHFIDECFFICFTYGSQRWILIGDLLFKIHACCVMKKFSLFLLVMLIICDLCLDLCLRGREANLQSSDWFSLLKSRVVSKFMLFKRQTWTRILSSDFNSGLQFIANTIIFCNGLTFSYLYFLFYSLVVLFFSCSLSKFKGPHIINLEFLKKDVLLLVG